MGFSLKGFVTGIAGAAGDVMKEEQAQTNKIIAQRTKNSYDNHMRYKEETEALRADIKKRDAEARSADPTLTDKERIAIASIPNFMPMFTQMLASGKQITVRDMLSVGTDVDGRNFDDWVSAVGKVAPATGAPAAVSTRFLGPSEQAQQRMAERSAAATGVPEAELRAFQTPPEKATVSSMGSLKLDVFKKPEKPIDSVETAYNVSKLQMMNAEREFGVDSKQYKDAQAANALASTYLDKNTEDASKEAMRLRTELIDEADPLVKEKKTKKIKALEYNILENKKATTLREPKSDKDGQEKFNKIKTMVDDYVANSMREDEGFDWKKYYDFKTYKGEDGSTYTSATVKAGMDIPEQRAVFAKERELARQALSQYGFITKTGAPIYSEVAKFMISKRIPVGQAASAPDVTPAPAPASMATATPAAIPATAATTPPATTAKGNAPTPAAIDLLKANPNLAADFEKKYPGYSAKTYLGK